MTKAEADQIVLAGKKYNVKTSINKVVDDYEVIFIDKITFTSFEAAKLVMNGFVIEKHLKQSDKENQPEKEDHPPASITSFKKSRKEKGHNSNWFEGKS